MAAAIRLRPDEIKTSIEDSCKKYLDRYDTDVDDTEPGNYQIKTFVKGKVRACYTNNIWYDENNKKRTFEGMTNFRVRTPQYSEEAHTRGSGKFDEEIQLEGTSPLSHDLIVWHQTQQFAQKIEVPADIPVSLDIYQDHNIVNKNDNKLLDTFLPERGNLTFPVGSDGFFAILGCETAKAKPKLGAFFGKQLSEITMAKRLHPINHKKAFYSITYVYDKLPAEK